MTVKNLSIRCYASTEQMERKDNQDFYFSDESSGLYLVADGMGGFEGGAVASRLASHLAHKFVNSIDAVFAHSSGMNAYDKILRAAIKEIHDCIVDESERLAFDKMGCTLVFLLFRDKKAYVVNAGDSPCYVYSEESLRQITRSHSKVDQMVRDEKISKKEARTHPNRNIVTRCLGGKYELARADIHVMEYYKNDRFFLCTDGVTKVLTDDEIKSFMKIKSPKQAIEKMMEAIKAAPPERSSTSGKIIAKDNATTMIVDVISLAKKEAQKKVGIRLEKVRKGEDTLID
ncbi:MAG: protein phosphatase 2C domain-containing protein [Pseudomonadota bacterium]